MPHADHPASKDGAHQWRTVIENARNRRLQADQLVVPLKQLAGKVQPPAEAIADALVSARGKDGQPDDPLLFDYIETLLKVGYIESGNVLLALLRHSRFSKLEKAESVYTPSIGMPTFEERMFTLLAQLHTNAEAAGSMKQTHGLTFALAGWLHVVRERESAKQQEDGPLHTLDAPTQDMYNELAVLAFTVFNHASFKLVDRQPWWKARRALVVEELEGFDLHVLQWMHSQYAGHLQALAKSGPFLEKDAKGLPILTDEQVLSSITELPLTNSRAGLYIWLNACLCARPLCDDTTMRNYLLVRYPNDMQSAAVDLLLASFDVLTNAMLRKEPRQSVKVIRSFICNKVPLLLSFLSGYMTSATIETCIQMAFMAISMDPLSPISAGAEGVRDLLKTTRLEFLQACALHTICSEGTISAILQESVALPRVTRYVKEGLVAQCATNTSRLEGLIQDLEAMQGNAGAIAGCIVDTINNFCANKDTMSLKTACNALTRKVSNLDIVMQYTQPAILLASLCTLLNGWAHDQDQSEFQPAYEEFASILLLILTAIHRYGLQKADLGLTDDDSFMAKLLQSKAQSLSPAELTEEQNKQFSKWVGGLYATDEHGDTTGIGDEVMSQCPPGAFYLLVPTLFEQSVLACKSNSLSVKTLKGGLEFLLEPFLLPSLIGGFSWIAKHSWEDHGDADVLLHILDKLLKPSSSSQEMQTMHKAILATVATPLEQSLQELVRKRPEKTKQATSLIEILKPYLNMQRTVYSSKAELEAWLSVGEGQISNTLRKTIMEMITWALNGASNPPPKYSHRLLCFAQQLIGIDSVLNAVVSELKDQTDASNGSIALDVCTALICAPTPSTYSPIAAFGTMPTAGSIDVVAADALRLSVADVQKLLNRPSGEAEAMVRLSRRVNAQLTVSQMSLMNLQAVTVQDQSTDQVMQDLGLDTAVDGTVSDEILLDQGVSLDQSTDFINDINSNMGPPIDLSGGPAPDFGSMQVHSNALQADPSQNIFGDLTMDLNQPSQQNVDINNLLGDVNRNQPNQEEDIFADLTGLDMGDNFDDFSYQ